MVIRALLLLSMVLFPAVLYVILQSSAPAFMHSCQIHSLHIREEAGQTVVAQGRWWIRPAKASGHGFFYGRIRFIAPDQRRLRDVIVDRNFTLNSRIVNGLLESETVSVSRISGDNVSDQDIERYVSPVLVKGHKTLSMLFRTPQGTLLSGLVGRPSIRCDTHREPDPPYAE